MRLRQQTLLAAALAAASIWPTWPPLFRIWSESTDYEHGPLVALIVAALVTKGAPLATGAVTVKVTF